MPIRLSDIIARQRWITVDIAGVDVRVAYTPNTITLRRSTELQHLVNDLDDNPDIDSGLEVARMFCDLVNEWDILDDDDVPYPIDVESLQDFPSNILTEILSAVQKDVEGHEKAKKIPNATSVAGSRPAGSLAPVQNGIR